MAGRILGVPEARDVWIGLYVPEHWRQGVPWLIWDRTPRTGVLLLLRWSWHDESTRSIGLDSVLYASACSARRFLA